MDEDTSPRFLGSCYCREFSLATGRQRVSGATVELWGEWLSSRVIVMRLPLYDGPLVGSIVEATRWGLFL